MIISHEIPQNEPVSNDFDITINGKPCESYRARVSAIKKNEPWPGHQRPIEESEMASFISVSTDEQLEFNVVAHNSFQEAIIRPTRKITNLMTQGQILSFTISEPGQYTLELDGLHRALHIFVNPVRDFSKEKENATYCFEKGIHHVGKLILKSRESVYIDEGAVVYGCICGERVNDIVISGYGIIDDSWEERASEDLWTVNGCIRFYYSTNVRIEGVVCRDSSTWNIDFYSCDRIHIDNIKIIGSWRYNTDGIDVCNSSNVIIENSFIRSFDDAIVIKGLPGYDFKNCENYFIRNCVVWCDWGHAIEIGAETTAYEMCHIHYEDCDIIHGGYRCLSIQNCCRAKVHDIHYKNMYIDYTVHDIIPKLFSVRITNGYGLGIFFDDPDVRGENTDIHYENIHIHLDDGMGIPTSDFHGIDSDHLCHNIHFHNITFNGERLYTLEQLTMDVNEYIHNITLD